MVGYCGLAFTLKDLITIFGRRHCDLSTTLLWDHECFYDVSHAHCHAGADMFLLHTIAGTSCLIRNNTPLWFIWTFRHGAYVHFACFRAGSALRAFPNLYRNCGRHYGPGVLGSQLLFLVLFYLAFLLILSSLSFNHASRLLSC